MSGKVVIQVENLSKHYRLGSIGGATLREDLGRWWARVRGKSDPWSRVNEKITPDRGGEGFWALRDVGFEVHQGEVLGVIGRNGAGKSTLLKILSRITSPTSGRALIRGRVGSLLEVGTGFHPELTGRENIYLNGAILGMTRAEVSARFDEIVEFAEMAKFIDTPVKRYSSGMTVRLAFAVAAHLEPEVLIIDEVLAVGDASFQTRCLGKMREVASAGRTVLFVSHNMQSIQALCSAAILISNGRLVARGSPELIITQYQSSNALAGKSEWTSQMGVGDECVRLHEFRLIPKKTDSNDDALQAWRTGDDLEIEMVVTIAEKTPGLCIGFDMLSVRGEIVMRSYQTDCRATSGNLDQVGRVTLSCKIQAGLLNAGVYSFAPRIGVHNNYWIINGDSFVAIELILSHGESPYWNSLDQTSRPGVISPVLPWRVKLDTPTKISASNAT